MKTTGVTETFRRFGTDRQPGEKSSAGFTAIEVAVVVLMAGILGAIAAPGWMRLRDRQMVNRVNADLYLALREAQGQALKTRLDWRASLRETDGRIEWSIHRGNAEPIAWQGTSAPVTIASGTTFRQRGGYYSVEFGDRGQIKGQLGRVTVTAKNTPTIQSCTITSTLLGTIRRGRGANRRRDGHTCY